jgi:hypothetical protein
MRSIMMLVMVLFATAALAQRDDTAGGARDGALERSQNSENPELRAELRLLSSDLKISVATLQKEFKAAAKSYRETAQKAKAHMLGANAVAPQSPYLEPAQFSEAKRASVKEKLPLDEIVKAAAANKGDVSTAIASVRAKHPTS